MLERTLKYVNKHLHPEHYYFSPEWIILGVNNTCNLHCKMCDVGTQSLDTNFAINLVGTSPLNMPLELYHSIIDQTHHYFPKAKVGFAFTEPLAYPSLEDAIRYAHDKNLFTSVTTNGLLLPAKADKIAKAGLDELYVSLDGLETTHNEIRGNAKSFQKAIEGIEKLLTFEERPTISIACVITEWNIRELKAFCDFFRSYPIRSIHFLHSVFATNDMAIRHNERWGHLYHATVSNVEENIVQNFDLNVLHKEISRIREEVFPFEITFSPELSSKEELEVYYNRSDIFVGKRCHDVFSMMMIKSDGSVIPAHGRCYNLTVGNLYEQSLKDIWNSSVFAKFRKDLRDSGGLLPACSRCCSALN